MIPALLLAAALAAGEPPAPAPAPAAGGPEGGSGTPAQAPAPAPRPEPLAVEVQLSRAEVRLGEPFELAVEVRHGLAERYALPAAEALPGAPFHAEGRGCAREERGATAVTRCTVGLAAFALGAREVPGFALAVETPAGAATLPVAGPRVTVQGVLLPGANPEAVPLRDLSPPVPLLVRSYRVLAIAAGALAAALALLLAARAWRRRRARRVEPAAPPTPEERLARRLVELAALGLGARGQGREHFFRLSEVVREYLAARTGVPALDLTTAEIAGRLDAAADPRVDLAALRAFLEGADLVKFARAPAGPERCADGIAFARTLAEALRPAPPPLPPAAAAPPASPPEARA